MENLPDDRPGPPDRPNDPSGPPERPVDPPESRGQTPPERPVDPPESRGATPPGPPREDRLIRKARPAGLSEEAIHLAIARLAARQHGNLTHRQLIAAGLGRRAIQHRVSIGQLHRVHRGVYGLGRPATTALERAAAAVLACGEDALLCDVAALALWGLVKTWPSRMSVTSPRLCRHSGITTHQRRTLTRRDRRRRHGIPVTSPARTLLDSATGLSERAFIRAVNDGLREGTVKQHQLEDVLSRRPSAPGAKQLRAAAGLAGQTPTNSTLEDDFVAFCRHHRLPTPLTNIFIGDYEVDAYFPQAALIVELDSWDFHRSRDAFERDRERDAAAMAAGHGTLRLTSRRMKDDPADEAQRLHAIIEERIRRGSGHVSP